MRWNKASRTSPDWDRKSGSGERDRAGPECRPGRVHVGDGARPRAARRPTRICPERLSKLQVCHRWRRAAPWAGVEPKTPQNPTRKRPLANLKLSEPQCGGRRGRFPRRLRRALLSESLLSESLLSESLLSESLLSESLLSESLLFESLLSESLLSASLLTSRTQSESPTRTVTVRPPVTARGRARDSDPASADGRPSRDRPTWPRSNRGPGRGPIISVEPRSGRAQALRSGPKEIKVFKKINRRFARALAWSHSGPLPRRPRGPARLAAEARNLKSAPLPQVEHPPAPHPSRGGGGGRMSDPGLRRRRRRRAASSPRPAGGLAVRTPGAAPAGPETGAGAGRERVGPRLGSWTQDPSRDRKRLRER